MIRACGVVVGRSWFLCAWVSPCLEGCEERHFIPVGCCGLWSLLPIWLSILLPIVAVMSKHTAIVHITANANRSLLGNKTNDEAISSDSFILNLPVHADLSHDQYSPSGWSSSFMVVMYLLLGLVGPSCRRKHSLGSVQITEQSPYSRICLCLCRLIELDWEFYFF